MKTKTKLLILIALTLTFSLTCLFLFFYQNTLNRCKFKEGDKCCAVFIVGSTGNAIGCLEEGHINKEHNCQKDKK